MIDARIKACIKTTRKELEYLHYPIELIGQISKYYVEHSPFLSFEEARKELKLPKGQEHFNLM